MEKLKIARGFAENRPEYAVNVQYLERVQPKDLDASEIEARLGATWISPEFQLYIMKDYRRLQQDENSRLSLDWNLNRALSKVNYHIHTDAVKESILCSCI